MNGLSHRFEYLHNDKIIFMNKENRKFLTGAEVAVQASIDAGAKSMFGYPITPGTEVFSGWIKHGQKYLQTEDEIAAGFAVCGAVIAGEKSFTATAGPGHVLMQDAFVMAEGMRLPFVEIIAQRGGPSSGTVIYSQQEVNLACYGGNGEGMRIVYSPSNLEEIYEFTRFAFNNAWQYRFPSIILSDGYSLKTQGVIDFEKFKDFKNIDSYPLVKEDESKHWRNIYTFEQELLEELEDQKKDFDKMAKEVSCSESFKTSDAEVLIIAHGIVGAATKIAVERLREKGKKVGLWRPKTLRPMDNKSLNKVLKNINKVLIVESSMGQLARLIKDEVDNGIKVMYEYLQKPAVGIEPEEIVKFFK